MEKDNNNRLLQCKFAYVCMLTTSTHSASCFIQLPSKAQQASSGDSISALLMREFSFQNKSQFQIHPPFHLLMQLLTLACCFANCTLLHLFDPLSDLSKIIPLHCFFNSPLQGRD